MNKLARLGAIAALPLLAGCFDASQSVVVDANGTATMTLEISMAPPMDILTMMVPPDELALLPEAQRDAMVAQIEGQLGDELCAPDEGDVPEGFTVAVESFTREDGFQTCRATMVGPIERLGEALDQGTDGPVTTLVEEGGGVYLFRFYYPFVATDDAAIDAETLALMTALTEGRFISMSITAPRILETTGELNGNTASFVIPATVMMTQPDQDYEFIVRFALR